MMRQFTAVVAAAVALRGALLLYGDWQDRHWNVKYTDVDYDVYSDAARYVVRGESPYQRATYRYASLVAWLLVPNVIWTRLWGKGVFCLFDVMTAWLIGKWEGGTSALPVALWLFNPFTFAISTRGSCDSVTVFLVMAVVILLRERAYGMAGAMWGVAVHWRLFPIIYGPSILFYLTHRSQNKHTSGGVIEWVKRVICRETVCFGGSAVCSLCLLGGVFYGLYGEDYVEHAIMYHLSRQDPRHNFALHFYPIYLTHWKSVDVALDAPGEVVRWLDLGRVSAGMQMVLIVATAVRYRRDLPLSFCLATLIFVAFNKVSTAQYFVWYFGLVPLLIGRRSLKSLVPFMASFLLWVIAQGHWLLWAYLLEFQGWSCHLGVWVASCLFLLAHVQLFGSILTTFA